MTLRAASSNESNACNGSPLSAIYTQVHPPLAFSSRTTRQWLRDKVTHHLLSNLLVRPPQSHNNRNLHTQVTERHDDALGDHIAARQTAKDVHEYGLYARIIQDDAERGFDRLGRGFAAGVEEVGAAAAVEGEGVDSVHGEASAVHWMCRC